MPYSPIPELNALWSLQKWEGFEEFALGFGLKWLIDRGNAKSTGPSPAA